MTVDVLAAEAAEITELEKGTPAQPVETPTQTEQPAQTEPQQPQAEAKPQTDDGVEIEETNNGRFVRHGAFHQERERRKDAERRAQEIEKRYAADMAKVTERLTALAHAQQRPAQQQPEQQIPDVNTDPIGHFQAKTALLEKKLADAEQWRQGQQQHVEQTDTLQRIGSEVSRLEAEFSRTNTDYPQAQAHLFETWKAEATVAGVSPEEAIRARSLEIVQLAARSNRNPAELAYQLAKARGYTGAKPNGNGQQPAQTGPTLETLQRGQQLSKSTSLAPGKPASGLPTVDALLAMDEEEFGKYADRNSKDWARDVERLMGLRA